MNLRYKCLESEIMHDNLRKSHELKIHMCLFHVFIFFSMYGMKSLRMTFRLIYANLTRRISTEFKDASHQSPLLWTKT